MSVLTYLIFPGGNTGIVVKVALCSSIEETLRERNYRLILETELYDLPPPPAADRVITHVHACHICVHVH